MRQFRRTITVLEETACTPGTGLDCDFDNLEARPHGFFAYAFMAIFFLTFTVTETKGGAGVACTVEEQIGALSTVSFSYNQHTRLDAFRGLSIARLLAQMDEILSPDVLAGGNFLPTADIASGAGVTAVTLRILWPMCWGFLQKWNRDAFTGLVPLSELKNNGKCRVTPNSSNLTGGAVDYWSITAGTLNITAKLRTVELPRPVEHVYVREEEPVRTATEHQIPGSGERLVTALACIDDGIAAFQQPQSWSMWVDNQQVLGEQDGDEWVIEEDMGRSDPISDPLTAIMPIVTTAPGRGNADCLVIRGDGKLVNVGSANGATAILTRWSQRISMEKQLEIQRRHGVTAEAMARYRARVEAMGQDEAIAAIGRAVHIVG